MSKFKKIKWLMFILKNDGIPQQTLTDDMDPIELYCTLVLLARVYVYVVHKQYPLDLAISMDIAKNKYAQSKRGIERSRLRKLREAYNTFLFEWESDPSVINIY